LMGYWYHFAIMFEAVFILTAVDTGTRVGRFFLQEMLAHIHPKFDDKRWWPGVIITSGIFTASWGYLVYTGDIRSIWPLFGMSNQLLASSGLIIATTMLIRMNKAKYAWLTAVPGLIMAFITMYAGYLQLTNGYLKPGKENYLLATLAVIIMILMIIVFAGAFMRWRELLAIQTTQKDEYGETVVALAEE
ncbi:MAG: carbon starvation CstA 5TM domain-containing protein, partial [Humidesulfovibrio sp.]|nr:carbon starvation CstA 5TM domain-containing protein [Humidesulfovibrio sp.]